MDGGGGGVGVTQFAKLASLTVDFLAMSAFFLVA